jgi:hypothetical protein
LPRRSSRSRPKVDRGQLHCAASAIAQFGLGTPRRAAGGHISAPTDRPASR